MCTVLFARDLHLLSKNRDKTVSTKEEILHEKDFAAVRTQGASYFSLGINKNGCAFVSTAINTPAWTAAASVGNLEEAQRLFKQENQGLTSPTAVLSELLPTVKSVQEWVDAIRKLKQNWMGYHLILADKNEGFVLEVYKDQIQQRSLKKRDAITNHFLHVKHGALKYDDYPSSFERLKFCQTRIDGMKNREDMSSILLSSDPNTDKQIWRFGHFATVSSTVLDLHKNTLWYTDNKSNAYIQKVL